MLLKEDVKLQENFTLNEFMTNLDKHHPSDEHKINLYKLSIFAQKLRDCVGELRVTSGWRSVEYNKSIGGDVGSYHTFGLAMDVEFIKRVNKKAVEDYGNWSIDTLLPLVNLIGFSNVGFYVGSDGKFKWIHLDIGKPWGNEKGWTKYSETLSYKVYKR